MPVPAAPAHLRRTLLRDQAFTALRDAIVSGQLAPGEMLTDKGLEAWLGVSRTPLREALARLATVGLLEIIPQKATRVSLVIPSQLRSMTEVLGALHAATVRESIPLLSPADDEALIQTAGRAERAHNCAAYAQQVNDFFAIFLARYNNHLILKQRNRLTPHLERALRVQSSAITQPTGTTLHQIARFARRRDREAAADATAKYFSAAAACWADSAADEATAAATATATPTTRHASRRLLRDEVYDTILAAIIAGTLEPGERLHDEELTEWLGVSRQPLREALTKLAEEGVVELIPRRVTRVTPVDYSTINEAMFVTGAFHEYAARRVVADLGEPALISLDEHLRRAHAAAAANDLALLGQAIRDYFLTFEYSTTNQVLIDTVESLSLHLIRFLTPRDSLTSIPEILRQLDHITALSRAGDAAGAGDAIHSLYAPTRANFLSTYREDPGAEHPATIDEPPSP